ncbi:MAG: hypothetical protein J0M12_16985, partial [Deltaproteobacteria bacterium]|nr:hypothetical protein [Deltaproteobacteria bacterium]
MNNKNSYLSLIGIISLSLITLSSNAFALRGEQGAVSMDAPLFCEPIAMMSSLRSCNVPGYKQIRTLEDLKRTSINLRAQGDTKFILCNDIDVSALGNQNAGNLADITLDGNGYTIRGLAQNTASTGNYFGGLFGNISRSNIKNLRPENFS